jgi:predicted acyltransferase
MAPDTRVSGTPPSARIASLDLFRGFLMFILIGADFLAGYPFVPDWLKHSTVFGAISLIDLGAPLFIFAVGISLGLVFLRCTTDGLIAAEQRRYVRRGFVLIAFGIIGSALLHRDIIRDWEVFQTIGLAGIIALPFITMPPRGRLAAAILLMLTFQAIGRYEYGDWLRRSDVGGLGGMLGGIAWAGVILAGSTVSASLREGGPRLRSLLVTMGIVGLVVAVALLSFQPFDKRLVTASYLALTIGLSAFTLLLFVAASCRPRFRFLPFTVLGANALTTFILHGLGLLALTALIPSSSPMGTVLIALAVLYAICYTGAGWLYRRRMFIRL